MTPISLLKKSINRFRIALAVAGVLSMLLMLHVETQLVGLLAFAVTTLFAGSYVAFFVIRYGRQEAAVFFDGGIHPSHGLLSGIPRTFRDKALYVVGISLSLLSLTYLLFNPVSPDPGEQLVIGAILLFTASLVPAELLSWLVSQRWGATPARHVVMGYAAVAAVLILLFGYWFGSLILGFLPEVTQGDEDLLRAIPVAVLVFFLAGLWQRDLLVTRWQSKLDAQAEQLKEAETARRLAEAQLAMLQAQIEPHFLYNTLASVQYLVRKDAAAADFLLTQLIRYLRHAMPKLRQPMSTLAQEFELADAYLQIARMRMGGRLSVDLELADALHEIPFPPLVLQTLVENALKHGVEPKAGPVHIGVCVRQVGDELVLQVKDNGVGLFASKATAGTGTGLPNIRERLAGIYGEGAQLSVVANDAGGVTSTVAVSLPADMPASSGASPRSSAMQDARHTAAEL